MMPLILVSSIKVIDRGKRPIDKICVIVHFILYIEWAILFSCKLYAFENKISPLRQWMIKFV